MDEEAREEATQQRADQPDDDVAEEAEAMASADGWCRPTGDEPDDDPGDDATGRKLHDALSFAISGVTARAGRSHQGNVWSRERT